MSGYPTKKNLITNFWNMRLNHNKNMAQGAFSLLNNSKVSKNTSAGTWAALIIIVSYLLSENVSVSAPQAAQPTLVGVTAQDSQNLSRCQAEYLQEAYAKGQKFLRWLDNLTYSWHDLRNYSSTYLSSCLYTPIINNK